jgi:hypothetical protein
MNNNLIVNLLENSEYNWLLENNNIEKTISDFDYLFSIFKENTFSIWYKVISLWLKGYLIDIKISDINIMKKNIMPIFYEYFDGEFEYIIYIQDLLKMKIGDQKYKLFLDWFNKQLNLIN